MLLALLVLLALPAIAATDAATDVGAVTSANLAEREAFWPYQVQLTRDWKPEGWEGDFGWGYGVLLTVDPSRGLRVDFGRFGKHWIPVEVTDVVERANRVRLGEEHKYGPNLVVALRNRLLDPSGDTLVEHPVRPDEREAFVLVHADPEAASFEEVARDAAKWAGLPGALLVLIPTKPTSDAHVYKACHEAGWEGAFLLDRFAEAYGEGYLEPARPRPHVQVLTREGRIVFEAALEPELDGPIAEAVARARSAAETPSSATKR
jgi:hypothetical protein